MSLQNIIDRIRELFKAIVKVFYNPKNGKKEDEEKKPNVERDWTP